MCIIHHLTYSCGCLLVTGVEHCTRPACRATSVYDKGWLLACPNKYGDCRRLPRAKEKGSESRKGSEVAKGTGTDSKHEVGRESKQANRPKASFPVVLTISQSECEKATEDTSNTETGKGSAIPGSTPVGSNLQAPKASQTAKRLSGKKVSKALLSGKPGKGSRKWGGMIDEELDLVDMEVDMEEDSEPDVEMYAE
ncbi:hypothetical protein MMC30_002778 [Trapelia coarctata]|nr:hypothetical protein [Trapelia coarctata]